MDPLLEQSYFKLFMNYDTRNIAVLDQTKAALLQNQMSTFRSDALLCVLSLFDQMIVQPYQDRLSQGNLSSPNSTVVLTAQNLDAQVMDSFYELVKQRTTTSASHLHLPTTSSKLSTQPGAPSRPIFCGAEAMPAFDPLTAIAHLEANKATVWPDATTQDAFLSEAKARLGGRSSDDKKEATKLAVETAKTLLTIAVALLVASGTLLQFARSNGVPWLSWTVAFFTFSVILLFVSMRAGLSAISDVYKRADGRTFPTDTAWSTAPVSKRVNVQSLSGASALLALLIGLGLSAQSTQTPGLSLTIPGTPQAALPAGPLMIDGTWTELRLKTAGNQELKLPPNLPTSGPLAINCK